MPEFRQWTPKLQEIVMHDMINCLEDLFWYRRHKKFLTYFGSWSCLVVGWMQSIGYWGARYYVKGCFVRFIFSLLFPSCSLPTLGAVSSLSRPTNSFIWSGIWFGLPSRLWLPYRLAHHQHAIILITTHVASYTDTDCTFHDCGHKNHSIRKQNVKMLPLPSPKNLTPNVSGTFLAWTTVVTGHGVTSVGQQGSDTVFLVVGLVSGMGGVFFAFAFMALCYRSVVVHNNYTLCLRSVRS